MFPDLQARATVPRYLLGTAIVAFVVVALVIQVRLPQSDLAVYHRYGLALLHSGQRVALPREYPALAGLLFAAVALVPGNFTLAFGLAMAIVLCALLWAGSALFGGRVWCARSLLYLGAGTIAVALGRYDLVPALAVVLAVALARRGRWSGAWAAAIVGTALKLFPALLLPGFLLAEWRETGRLAWRKVVATAGVAGACATVQMIVAPGTLLSPVRYELRRGFEVSSTGGSLTMLLHPASIGWQFGFGAWQVVGPDHEVIGVALGVAALGGLAAIWVLAWRGRLSVPTVSLAVLSVAVLTDRALAPQYLIWLAPLWALWPLRAGWLTAAALTTLVFPVAYALEGSIPGIGHAAGMYPAMAVAAARNLALLLATAAWLRDELRSRTAAPPQTALELPAPTTPLPMMPVSQGGPL